MDTETLEKVIGMLNAELQVIEDSYVNESDKEEWFYIGKRVGKEEALQKFRDHLERYVDKQVAHMETEQGM